MIRPYLSSSVLSITSQQALSFIAFSLSLTLKSSELRCTLDKVAHTCLVALPYPAELWQIFQHKGLQQYVRNRKMFGSLICWYASGFFLLVVDALLLQPKSFSLSCNTKKRIRRNENIQCSACIRVLLSSMFLLFATLTSIHSFDSQGMNFLMSPSSLQRHANCNEGISHLNG